MELTEQEKGKLWEAFKILEKKEFHEDFFGEDPDDYGPWLDMFTWGYIFGKQLWAKEGTKVFQ